ncbi:tetratricopeptide repeat protein [Lewinella sp. LCG006]|uniref:tetratricopeptide repeat protein n=1 Tax=Lewinella sp. LCG006 TaxID=3231911 RepID=UPI00345F7F30
MNRRRKEDWDTRIVDLVTAYETGEATAFLDMDAYHDLIEYYQNEEQFEKALTVARQACSQYRFSTDFYAQQAQLLLYTNRHGQALEILELALTFAPGDFELNLLLAEAFIRTGKNQAGLARLAPYKLQASLEDLSEILLVESIAYERQGQYEHMFYALKAALEADWTNERALERVSLCTDFCRKHDEACTLYRKIIDEDPYNALAWYYLGQALVYLRKFEEALEAYEYAFLADPDLEEAYLEFAELSFEIHQPNIALETYKEMAERFGTDGDLLLRMGSCYHEMSQHETARAYLEQAARIEPHNDEVIFKIGECYAAQEKWVIARSFFEKAIRMNGEDENYYQALAEAAFATNDFSEAENAYDAALDLAPDNSQLWLDLAWFYLEMLRPQEALELLEEANEALYESEIEYSYIACLFSNGRRQEGLTKLAEILTENYPEHAYLFDWHPPLRNDAEVIALISLFKPEGG